MPEATASTPPAPAFTREGTRHVFRIRAAEVTAVREVGPQIRRVTLGGPDLHDFSSLGPTDHVKLFLPDPETGELVAPTVVDGRVVRPAGSAPIARDFTPLPRPAASDDAALDLDFVLHEHTGPARVFAERVAVGDVVAMGGPRGSRGLPHDIDGLVLVGDATALPALSRWVAGAPEGAEVRVVVAADRAGVGEYADLLGAASVTWVDRPDDLIDAVRALGEIGPRTFVFAAGEAGAMADVRRCLRRELALPTEQIAVTGYWKHGERAFDHHSPLGDD
ncbi:siderophore-interacting protein [Agromyces sp. Marseille-P2726]|uniref:siderophore-interacting protein n=1 Tax=Agromyces sp. Marseille-P2726 TaxID=2709132 RepID=UPI00156FE69A|nr:siderophore-interacting protein [Agromyces sp. Marseille-P2726]